MLILLNKKNGIRNETKVLQSNKHLIRVIFGKNFFTK